MRKMVIVGILLAVALAGAACSDKKAGATAPSSGAVRAAEIRVALDQLLGEHVVLAAAATNAALGGRTVEFDAAAKALDANSHDVANAIAGPLKKTPEQAYEFWASHIGFFVSYTQGIAAKDTSKQNAAVNSLLGYAKSFGTLVNGALPSLPADAVEGLVKQHILSLKSVVDAQAKKDYAAAFTSLREAYKHMDMIGGALAQAVAG